MPSNAKLDSGAAPLSNLDAELRAQMRVEIARLHRELGVTMVYVTHDQVEAMTLADRIVVLLGLRPEHLMLGEGPNRVELTADLSESPGGSTLVCAQTRAVGSVVLQAPGRRVVGKGKTFTAGFDAAQAYVFDKDGRAF